MFYVSAIFYLPVLTTSVAIGPFDGKVAAVLSGGQLFISSPNMDEIPQPPFGVRDVRLRRDQRYGDDDPTLWPQPYIKEECHLGAIPRRVPLHTGSELDLMWENLNDGDLIRLQGNLLDGLVRLNPTLVGRYRRYIDDLKSRVQIYRCHPNHTVPNQRVLHLANSLNHAFARMESLTLTERQMAYAVTLVQRLYLELTGALDYILIYKPRMDGITEPASRITWTVGVFTTDPVVAQEFFKAGIPFWLIRPVKHLESGTYDKVVELLDPVKKGVCLDDADPRSRTIFSGQATDQRKYNEFSRYARSAQTYPDPFNSTSLQPPAPSPSSIPIEPSSGRAPSTSTSGQQGRAKTAKPCMSRFSQLSDTILTIIVRFNKSLQSGEPPVKPSKVR